MNEPIVFVGPNKRVTPLQVESIRSGFTPLQACVFDYEDGYASAKLREFLDGQDQALFRFIYPFYDITYKNKVAELTSGGMDLATAQFRIFEEFVHGWQDFIGSLGTRTQEVNSLEIMLKERDKAFQYERLGETPGLIPETLDLAHGRAEASVLDMIERFGGVVYKPISGSESQGIYIIEQEGSRYTIKSDIKGSRRTEEIEEPILVRLQNLHNPSYVVQERIPYARVFGDYDYDLRVHVIDGQVVGTAAFVYNSDTMDEEVHSIEARALEDPRIANALEHGIGISLEAVRKFGLDVSGVDLMISENDYKPRITEVNCFPGWTLLEVNPDLDIAQKEVELYQRLLR